MVSIIIRPSANHINLDSYLECIGAVYNGHKYNYPLFNHIAFNYHIAERYSKNNQAKEKEEDKMIIEIIGYIGMIILLIGFIIKERARLHLILTLGCIVIVVYSALIKSYPVLILNVIAGLINLRQYLKYRIKKENRRDNEWRNHRFDDGKNNYGY